MWHKQHEYSMAQLLDHPVLRMAMKTMGMDRRAVELLLERAEDDPDRQPDRVDDPVLA